MAVLIPVIISCCNTNQGTDTDSNKDNGKVGYSYCLHVFDMSRVEFMC